MQSYQKVIHNFAPVFNEQSEILILGSLPSVKSRENKFYYGHPQNRFWKVLAYVTRSELPVTIEDKKELLLRSHIALWDVLESCLIIGSSDSSIKQAVPNDLSVILKQSRVSRIFTNGGKADSLYRKLCYPSVRIEAVCLPSTSPANAAWSLEKLNEHWEQALCVYNR